MFFSFIVVQLERGAHKVSEKLYSMKKFLYIRKLLTQDVYRGRKSTTQQQQPQKPPKAQHKLQWR